MKVVLTAIISFVITANSYADDCCRYHSSTAQEGFWRGVGSYLAGAGLNNVYNSGALINYQEALSMSYDNYLKWVETRFEARLLNKQYREMLDPYRPFNKEEYLAMHEKYKSKNVKPGIHYNGNVYRNFQAFKCSKDYKLMIQERDRKEILEEIHKDIEKELLKESYEAEWVRRQTPSYLLDRRERQQRLERLGILSP